MADQLRALFVLATDYPWTTLIALSVTIAVIEGVLNALVLVFRRRD